MSLEVENTCAQRSVRMREFDETVVQRIIRDVLKVKLHDRIYEHEKLRYESGVISLEIRDRLRRICQDETYKIAVNVFLGEIREDGIETGTQCVWNPKYDCIVCGYYKNSSLFAVATVFASYV